MASSSSNVHPALRFWSSEVMRQSAVSGDGLEISPVKSRLRHLGPHIRGCPSSRPLVCTRYQKLRAGRRRCHYSRRLTAARTPRRRVCSFRWSRAQLAPGSRVLGGGAPRTAPTYAAGSRNRARSRGLRRHRRLPTRRPPRVEPAREFEPGVAAGAGPFRLFPVRFPENAEKVRAAAGGRRGGTGVPEWREFAAGCSS
jgi:hypothetical protein